MFNFIKEVFNTAENIISTPTDMLGITKVRAKKEAKAGVEILYASGDITSQERDAFIRAIDNI